MNKDRGNIIFFIGVLIFAVSLLIDYFADINAVITNLSMGIGVIIEFVGLCITYKKDKDSLGDDKKTLEDETLAKVKAKESDTKKEKVIEVETEKEVEE